MVITTSRGTTRTRSAMSSGVPQGSPLSPCVFNLYMNTHAEFLTNNITRRGKCSRSWEPTKFADDLKLMAENVGILQSLLQLSGQWAATYGMKWSTSNCVVLILLKGKMAPFKLSDDVIRINTKAKYVGYQISNKHFLAKGSIERLKRVRSRLCNLRNTGIHASTTDAYRLLQIFDSFILATGTYGIHMTPTSRALFETWKNLRKDIMIFTTGCFSELKRSRLSDIA